MLVIFTDDHRYSGVHALGGMDVKTPNIDLLAADGVTFDNTYLMGAFTGATCVASRAMLLTGTNLFELGGAGHKILEKSKTIGETFQKEGYNTHIIGKWHQDGESLKRSFTSGDKIMGRGLYLVDHFRMHFTIGIKQAHLKKKMPTFWVMTIEETLFVNPFQRMPKEDQPEQKKTARIPQRLLQMKLPTILILIKVKNLL